MKTTSIQLEADLLEEIRKIAKEEGRSLASQVRIFLRHAVTRNDRPLP